MTLVELKAKAVVLKGSMTTLTKICLYNSDLEEIEAELKQKISQGPNFFYNAPVLLDLQNLAVRELDFAAMQKLLKNLNLVLIGVSNANEMLQQMATDAGIAIIRSTNSKLEKNQNEQKQDSINVKDTTTNKTTNNILVTEPIRSGQQIYAPDGDIIITNSVSNGAELLAKGNIHVYGALRGRALAGIDGDNEARIFCKSLEAELISIAGNYKISEDIDHYLWQRPIQVILKSDNLELEQL